MIKKIACLLLCIIFCKTTAQAQYPIHLEFQVFFDTAKLVLNDGFYSTKKNKAIRIDVLKFYISNIAFFKNDKLVWKEPNSFHLVNMENPSSLKWSITNPKNKRFDSIQFSIGIDSSTNMAGVMGGDLDPTKGMYWTWQTGYIHFKLEGNSPDCPTRQNIFQYHIGGYQYPFNTFRTLRLKTKNKKNIYIRTDIKPFLDEIDISKQNEIMSPNKDAVMLSEKLTKLFSIGKK